MVQYMNAVKEDDDYVLVDATDIACNSTRIRLSQKGYNSDMTFEPQVTLLYIYSAKKHKPLFFRLVAGNIRDVGILKNALVESGIHNAVFISDKGFYSAGNVARLDELGMKYIIPLRRDNAAIDYGPLKDIETKPCYFKFRDRFVFYVSYPHEGKQICIFLDGRLKEDEKTDYLNRITTLPEHYTVKKYQEKIKARRNIRAVQRAGRNRTILRLLQKHHRRIRLPHAKRRRLTRLDVHKPCGDASDARFVRQTEKQKNDKAPLHKGRNLAPITNTQGTGKRFRLLYY